MNGQLLSAAVAQAAQNQAPVQVAAPLNDAQLIALVAAQLEQFQDPREAVAIAVDILAHAIVAVHGGLLAGRINQIRRELTENN